MPRSVARGSAAPVAVLAVLILNRWITYFPSELMVAKKAISYGSATGPFAFDSTHHHLIRAKHRNTQNSAAPPVTPAINTPPEGLEKHHWELMIRVMPIAGS